MSKFKQIHWKRIIITYFITLVSCLLLFFPIDLMSNPTIFMDKLSLYIMSNIIINTIIIIPCIIIVYNIETTFYIKRYYYRILIELVFLSIISTLCGYLLQIIFIKYMDIITYLYRNIIHRQSFFVDFL